MIKYFLKPLGYSVLSLALSFGVSILAVLLNGGSDRFQYYLSMKFFGLIIVSLSVWFTLLKLSKKITSKQHRDRQVNTHLFFVLPFALVSFLAFYDKADSVGYFAASMSALNVFLAAIIFYVSYQISKPKVQGVYSPNYSSSYNSAGTATAGQNAGGYTDYAPPSTPAYTPPTMPPPSTKEWIYTDKGLVYDDKAKYGYGDAYGTKKKKAGY